MTGPTTNRALLVVAGLSIPPGERVVGLVEVELGTALVAIPPDQAQSARPEEP